jgi:hypothetical protein
LGYVFLYAYVVTGEQLYLKTAEMIASKIMAAPDISYSALLDMISGAAGTGFFLLKKYSVTANPHFLHGAEMPWTK